MREQGVIARIYNVCIEAIGIIFFLIALIFIATWWLFKFTRQKIIRCLCRKEELQLLHTLGEIRKDIRFLELINGNGDFPVWRGKHIDAIEIEICARKRERKLVSFCLEKGIAQWKINAFVY